MHLSQTEDMGVLEGKGMLLAKDPKGLMDASAMDDKAALVSDSAFNPMAKSSLMKQLAWLSWRELTNIRRDTTALAARFGITIFLNLLFGLIFLNVRQNPPFFLSLYLSLNTYGFFLERRPETKTIPTPTTSTLISGR
jgi:hypothetical protein